MTPAIDLLNKNNCYYQLHPYENDKKTSTYGMDAAEKLGIQTTKIFKTLIINTEEKELITALVPVARSLDLKLLAKAANTKRVVLADKKLAETSTGYLIGGISPFAQKQKLRTFIDASAIEFDRIFVSAGKRGMQLQISPLIVLELTQAVSQQICK